MKYRHMGKTGKRVSALGFGCMRLPILEGDSTKIDKKRATEMVEYAIDNGINYFDTAYVYHGNGGGQGQSEFFTGEVLKPHRDNVYIATKLPTWAVHTEADFDKYLDRQLKALQVDTIDFYLMHSLNQGVYDNLKKLEYQKFIERAKKSGKIQHIGFSFHDEFPAFENIVNDYDWEFCQIQYNFLDRDYQAGEKGLRIAEKKGIGIIVMEPLRGGLITDVVKPAKDILSEYDENRTMVDWAFSWLYNEPSISTCLSGMSTLDQVKENIKLAENSDSGYMTLDELNAIDKATGIIKRSIKVPCTACRYCMPCPSGVDIPGNFTRYNDYFYFEPNSEARKDWIKNYNMFMSEDEMAKNCIQCGECETHCPQNIKISEEMPKVAALFKR